MARVRDGAVVESQFLQVGKRIWQLFFLLVVLGFAWWLLKNVLIGKFVRELNYFVPASFLASLSVAVLYFIGFRANQKLFVNVHISLGTLVVLALVSETTIRVWDRFDPIFRPPELEDSIEGKRNATSFSPYKPGSVGKTHGNPVRINSLGFRGPEISIPKAANIFRISVLGDSFTFGEGVAESQIYTSLLQEEFSARFQTRKIEIINLGVMGSSAIDQIKLLRELGSLLQPDLVVIGFNGNDVREGDQVTDAERRRWGLPVPSMVKDFLRSYSKLFHWLTAKYDALLRNAGVRPDVITSIASAYNPQSEEWRRFVGAYEDILKWARTQGIPAPLVGFLLPAARYGGLDWVQMDPSTTQMIRQFEQAERTLKEMGFYTIGYLPLFRGHNKQDMTVSKWEGHPNALAHRLYAEGFVNAVVALGLID